MDFLATRCAICQTAGNAAVMYPATLSRDSFNQATFSARRLPDRVHYRIVKCMTCGLVRSDPIADPEMLSQLYARSTVSYEGEIPGLRETYGRYLARLEAYGVTKGALLEIGCGSGFFLEEALAQGYEVVRGVEPSVAAVAAASPAVRSGIVPGVMKSGLFAPQTFDVICLFQVFDHIAEPAALLDECFAVLKPGGKVLCLNHNVDALSARLLGARSPIVDVEHTFLYSPTTISAIFRAHGFQVRTGGAAVNTCTLFYLAWLMPLPGWLKRPALRLLGGAPIGRVRLRVPLGNLYLIAERPS